MRSCLPGRKFWNRPPRQPPKTHHQGVERREKKHRIYPAPAPVERPMPPELPRLSGLPTGQVRLPLNGPAVTVTPCDDPKRSPSLHACGRSNPSGPSTPTPASAMIPPIKQIPFAGALRPLSLHVNVPLYKAPPTTTAADPPQPEYSHLPLGQSSLEQHRPRGSISRSGVCRA
jgi:hypothetical protein